MTDENRARGDGEGFQLPFDAFALVMEPRLPREPRFHVLDQEQAKEAQHEGLTRAEILGAVFGNSALKDEVECRPGAAR